MEIFRLVCLTLNSINNYISIIFEKRNRLGGFDTCKTLDVFTEKQGV